MKCTYQRVAENPTTYETEYLKMILRRIDQSIEINERQTDYDLHYDFQPSEANEIYHNMLCDCREAIFGELINRSAV